MSKRKLDVKIDEEEEEPEPKRRAKIVWEGLVPGETEEERQRAYEHASEYFPAQNKRTERRCPMSTFMRKVWEGNSSGKWNYEITEFPTVGERALVSAIVRCRVKWFGKECGTMSRFWSTNSHRKKCASCERNKRNIKRVKGHATENNVQVLEYLPDDSGRLKRIKYRCLKEDCGKEFTCSVATFMKHVVPCKACRKK